MKMSEKKIRFTLRIVARLNEALARIAEADGLTKQAVIITAIREFVDRTNRE